MSSSRITLLGVVLFGASQPVGKRDVSAKRAEILEAAAAVFREAGYETASMDRIAERAGASKRTVYNHFGSKEALFEAVVAWMMASQAEAKAIPFDPEAGLASQLRRFADAKAAYVADEDARALMRVVLGVAIRRPGYLEELLDRHASDEDTLVRWLRDADAAGALDVPEPDVAAGLFWAMAGGALFWPAVAGHTGPVGASRLADEIVETFLARFQAS